MTKEQIQAVLNLAEIHADEWVQINNINSFDIANDGNQVISANSYYYFNTSLELLLIKEYYYKKLSDQWILIPTSENTFDIALSFESITSVLFGEPYSESPNELLGSVYN